MEIFVVKTLVLISFFVFRFILEDTKMEMMKRWIIQGDEKEVVNEKAEEEV